MMLTNDEGGFETATLNSVSNHELIFIVDNPLSFTDVILNSATILCY